MNEMKRLVKIMSALRNKETGCPWDLKQTHTSLKKYLLEESYEVIEAIDSKDMNELKLELGDLLLQVVFHSQLASETQNFDLEAVAKAVSDKLVLRHPHIFGDKKKITAEEVKINWELIKKEKEGKKRILDGIPKRYNSLLRSLRIQEKAAAVGFEWPDKQGIIDKLNEELEELYQGIKNNDYKNIEEEMGDILFILVNFSKFLKIDPEEALQKCNDKFIRRFNYIEKALDEKKITFKESNLKEMDELWDEAKKEERKN